MYIVYACVRVVPEGSDILRGAFFRHLSRAAKVAAPEGYTTRDRNNWSIDWPDGAFYSSPCRARCSLYRAHLMHIILTGLCYEINCIRARYFPRLERPFFARALRVLYELAYSSACLVSDKNAYYILRQHLGSDKSNRVKSTCIITARLELL